MNEYKPVLKDSYDALNRYLRQTGREIPCRSIREKTEEFTFKTLIKLYEDKENNPSNNLRMFSYMFGFFMLDIYHELPHVFVENDDIVSFLKDMKVPDISVINGFIKQNEEPLLSAEERSCLKDTLFFKENPVLNESLSSEPVSTNLYAVHTRKNGYLIGTYRNDNSDGSSDLSIYCCSDEECCCIDISSQDIENTDISDRLNKLPLIRFALNFMSYCQAFPECLLNGVPDMFTRKERAAVSCPHVLKISPEILDKDFSNGRVVTPHFRRGHFRRLESDYYTKKKGQIVFVKASMVRCRAKTLKGQSASLHER